MVLSLVFGLVQNESSDVRLFIKEDTIQFHNGRGDFLTIHVTSHAVERCVERLGWEASKAVKESKKAVKSYIKTHNLDFINEFTVPCGLQLVWVVARESYSEYTIVTLRPMRR